MLRALNRLAQKSLSLDVAQSLTLTPKLFQCHPHPRAHVPWAPLPRPSVCPLGWHYIHVGMKSCPLLAARSKTKNTEPTEDVRSRRGSHSTHAPLSVSRETFLFVTAMAGPAHSGFSSIHPHPAVPACTSLPQAAPTRYHRPGVGRNKEGPFSSQFWSLTAKITVPTRLVSDADSHFLVSLYHLSSGHGERERREEYLGLSCLVFLLKRTPIMVD